MSETPHDPLTDDVRAVEAVLFAAAEPLSTDDIQAHVGEGVKVGPALDPIDAAMEQLELESDEAEA